MNEALEYQRCCNDTTTCEQLMAHIIQTCVECELQFIHFHISHLSLRLICSPLTLNRCSFLL